MVIKQAFAAAQLRRTSTTATGRAFGASFFSAAMALLIAVVSADATRLRRPCGPCTAGSAQGVGATCLCQPSLFCSLFLSKLPKLNIFGLG